jgi:hypothetical protein
MVFVCCFCDHVHDESTGTAELRMSVLSRTPTRQDIVVSYTCCHACLQDDPQAITFRTRQNKPNLPGSTAGAGARQSVAA